MIGLGVDRLDYTKGIPERLAALDGSSPAARPARPSDVRADRRARRDRSSESYAPSSREIDRRVAEHQRAPRRAGTARRRSYYHKAALTIPSLVALYRLAHFCIVSSLHDGMNLVAKEFVAARDDEDGVLVLSGLAGAAQELRGRA